MNIDRDRLKRYDDVTAPPVSGAPPLPDGRRTIAAPLGRRFAASNDVAPPPATAPGPMFAPPAAPVTTSPAGVPVPPRPVAVAQSASPRAAEPAPAQPPKAAGDTNVTINITMPKFKKPTLPDWDWRRIRRWASIIVGLIVASLLLRAAIVGLLHYRTEQAAKHRLDMIEQRRDPTFSPLLPKNKTAAALAAAYDAKRDSYSYNDTFKGLQLVVSQQRLPDNATPQSIAKIAASMDAKTPLVTDRGTAYLASGSGGAQLVVLSTKSLLIFVQSPFTHSSDDWKTYLDTLQA